MKTASLRDLFIQPEFDNAKAIVSFSKPKAFRGATWKITAGKKKAAGGRIPGGKGKVSFEAKLKGFTPWTIDEPFLYTLTLDMTIGKESARLSQNFGMRKFHVANKQIHLNNSPFYVRGIIRGREAHDHPNLSKMSELEYYEKFIRAAKKLGFNFIRFHSKVPPDAYFDAADRLGILTHVEIRKYYGKYQKERELMDHDPVLVRKKDWCEVILHIRNRASLMVYCLGNEINKPGRNPEVAERADQLRRLDSTRLFIDTCARGEYDRGNIDLDVQHMGYFAPFGRNYGMFDTTSNWAIFGSVHEKPMADGGPGAKIKRELPVNFPVSGHEVGHYIVHRDIDALKRKFAKSPADEPWWLDELIKLRQVKGLAKDYPKLIEASERYQFVWHKQVFESIRKSPILGGFHFLQLADTELYENANGLIDCFDDIKANVNPVEFRKFNSDAVLVADLPRRTFMEGEKVIIPVWLSNCSHRLKGTGVLKWRLAGAGILLKGALEQLDVEYGLKKVATVEVVMPRSMNPRALRLSLELKVGRTTVANDWNLWLYPDRPEMLKIRSADVRLRDIRLVKRYPQLTSGKNEKLLITDRFDSAVFRQLEAGKDVLMLYRIPETRDRAVPREKYYMPSTWDRFKAVIWDRGHNLGAFMRPHAALKAFPTDGFLDFQFAGIIDDCEKFSLDGFPVPVSPIIQGVDKAVRDRYDVFTFKLRELQPDWSMRKFAYLFDVQAGKGRLMMCGFNLTGLEKDVPEACAMFESLAACVTDPKWRPKANISLADLTKYLVRKGRQPRIKERMMTQYWQLDAEPLESAQYWKDARAWIEKK